MCLGPSSGALQKAVGTGTGLSALRQHLLPEYCSSTQMCTPSVAAVHRDCWLALFYFTAVQDPHVQRQTLADKLIPPDLEFGDGVGDKIPYTTGCQGELKKILCDTLARCRAHALHQDLPCASIWLAIRSRWVGAESRGANLSRRQQEQAIFTEQ